MMAQAPGLSPSELAMPVKELAIIAGWARRALVSNPEAAEAKTVLRLVEEVLFGRARIVELQTELAELKKGRQ